MFLENFLNAYPEFKGRKIFLTGESYAGHYIPVIARHIQKSKHPDINIAGLAIGNGWVDPFYQYPAYPKFAFENELIGKGHEMLLGFFNDLC